MELIFLQGSTQYLISLALISYVYWQILIHCSFFHYRVSSQSFIKANSSIERGVLDLKNENEADISNIGECFGPLSNVRFAVFGLGSSAYPNFCAFGNFLNKILNVKHKINIRNKGEV